MFAPSRSSVPMICMTCVIALTAALAAADPVTHFSSGTSYISGESTGGSQDPAYFISIRDTAGGLIETERTLDALEGTALAKTQVDLSTGTLKAVSTVVSTGDGNTDGQVFAFARADFGDSFRAFTDGSPYTWTEETVVHFSVDLSGMIQRSGTGIIRNGSTSFGITILQAGGMDPYVRWLEGDASAFSEWFALRIHGEFYSLEGDNPVDPLLTGFPQMLDIDFMPNGDFDWIATLITDVDILGTSSTPGSSISADFFNTAALGYTGPEGTVTFSASGAFPDTLPLQAIPTPGGSALLAVGLVLLAARRRSAA